MHVKPDMAVPLNVNMAPTGNILTAIIPSGMCCRKYVLKKKRKKKQTHTSIQRNQSTEQLVSVRIPVNHSGLSITTMTDRIKEGFVVRLKF